jgi:hypothetical protein
MRRSNLTGVILLTLATTTLSGQDNGLGVTDPSWNGIWIRFVTKVEPSGDYVRDRLGGAVLTEPGKPHHVIDDPVHKRTFGYDLRLEPSADGNAAQLRIEPLRAPQYSVKNGWTLLGLPRYPVVPNLRIGDTVALDLLVNPATGQKIVDYLTLERADRPPANRAHDFSLADVQLSLDRPRVLTNGKLVESTANFQGGTSAAVVWLYLDGHGRFIMSLFPNDRLGFQKNGTAAGNTLTFRDGPTEYRVECAGAVAPGDGPYNLYVVHEPGWRADSPSVPVELGSAGNAAWITGKH